MPTGKSIHKRNLRIKATSAFMLSGVISPLAPGLVLAETVQVLGPDGNPYQTDRTSAEYYQVGDGLSPSDLAFLVVCAMGILLVGLIALAALRRRRESLKRQGIYTKYVLDGDELGSRRIQDRDDFEDEDDIRNYQARY